MLGVGEVGVILGPTSSPTVRDQKIFFFSGGDHVPAAGLSALFLSISSDSRMVDTVCFCVNPIFDLI